MDLLNALLDLVDALSTGVAVAVFWYAWVVPPDYSALPPPKRPSEPDELEPMEVLRPDGGHGGYEASRGTASFGAAPGCACGGTSDRRLARIRSIPSAGRAREK